MTAAGSFVTTLGGPWAKDEPQIILKKPGKHPLGLVEGATENTAVVQALIDNLIERGLDPTVCRLFIIDGAKALSKVTRRTFGAHTPIQRCQLHKARNVIERLPKPLHAAVRRALRQAWELSAGCPFPACVALAEAADALLTRRAPPLALAHGPPERGAGCGAEGFRITAVGPGACAARAGRLGRPERLNGVARPSAGNAGRHKGAWQPGRATTRA